MKTADCFAGADCAQRAPVHLIDGSFEGFLTSVFDAYNEKRFPERICARNDYQYDFTRLPQDIATDTAKADRVSRGIIRCLGEAVYNAAWSAFLSDDAERFTKIFRYLALGFKVGRSVNTRLAEPAVLDVFELGRRVGRECQLMMGFVRFSVMEGGIQYAAISPACNQLPMLMPHFVDRMPDIPFVIHDTKRHLAGIYDTKEICYAETGEIASLPELSEDEHAFRSLWRAFYNAIAIKERINPKLQMNLMPKRFWHNMTEHNGI